MVRRHSESRVMYAMHLSRSSCLLGSLLIHWRFRVQAAFKRPDECAHLRAQTTVIPYDEDFVKAYFEMPDEEVDVTRMSPWLLRIELNREMMVRACGAFYARIRGLQ